MTDNGRRLQILQENYNKVPQPITLKEWVQTEADNDPSFFYWFFDHPENLTGDFGTGMTPEQQKEWDRFLSSLSD